jgi:hypothetical protein
MLSPFYLTGIPQPTSTSFYDQNGTLQLAPLNFNTNFAGTSAQPSGKGGGLSITDLPVSKLFGADSSIATSINQWGATNLGTAAPTGVGGAGAGGGVTLTSGIGTVAGGFAAGGLGASLTGGDPTAGSIAGGLGSGAALAFGATGPVGIAAGAIAGVIGGKLFGKKKPNPASMFGAGRANGEETAFSATGEILAPKFSSKHLDESAARQVFGPTSAYTQALSKVSGLDFSKISSIVGGTDFGKGILSLGDYKGRDEVSKASTYMFELNDPQGLSTTLRTKLGPEMLRRAATAAGRSLTPEQVEQYIAQADQLVATATASTNGQGGATGGTMAAPMIRGKQDTEAESFSSFLERYRSTGAVEPRRANTNKEV